MQVLEGVFVCVLISRRLVVVNLPPLNRLRCDHVIGVVMVSVASTKIESK